MISVALADDHQLMLDGLSMLLRDAPNLELVGTADTGDGIEAIARSRQPRVIVCDVSMPPFGAIELAGRIKDSGLDSRVIALTIHETPQVARSALDAGVAAYVLKKYAFGELLAAIDTVATGGRYISPTVAGALESVDAASQRLSRREQEVLQSLASGLTYKEIAAQLSVSARTVETYRARLLQKLGVRTNAELIHRATKIGWI
ncbi:MAG: response regulator transcription factor [Planctomycetota bacterium]